MNRVPDPNEWQKAEIVGLGHASANIRLVKVRPQVWVPFKAGQHIDIRLTAEDGYQASRSYSVASPPHSDATYDLLIDRLTGGEVSGFFHDHAETGAEVEVKGPIGGHFVWQDRVKGSILLVAGGSGIAPILSMIRHRIFAAKTVPIGLIYATRRAADIVSLDELRSVSEMDPLFSLEIVLSSEAQMSPNWRNGRVDQLSLARFLTGEHGLPETVYVCGSNRFAEAVVSALIALGVSPHTIRTERFGGAAA